MMIRISTNKLFLLVVAAAVAVTTFPTGVVHAQRAACDNQQSVLDSCLTTVGASDDVKNGCNACINSIATNTLVKGAIGTFCETSNTGACTELLDCPCSTCGVQAVSVGECAVTDERSTSGSNCNEAQWGGPLSCGEVGPTDPPVNPPPSQAPACDTFETQLDTCMDNAGATEDQKSACETCIESIANLAGAIDDETSATCAEVDGLACSGLETNCDCVGCDNEKIAYGQCSIDEERLENGSTQCGPVTCGPQPPTEVPQPTEAPSSAYSTTTTGNMVTVLLLASIAGIMFFQA
mmetsp:Transcript_21725/g.51296  ORF Transcript_21725/g.51296 Transcript_21725/m.51296 type:complete len:294 (-) Transcript_21725:78-959(-)